MGLTMPLYQFHLRHADGSMNQVDQELGDDLAAFKVAEALSSDFDVEVVQNTRFIAHIMKASIAAKREKFAA